MESNSRVLIVDDEDSNVDMLARRLSRCGYNVITANDGEQALSRIEQSHIDLVLLNQMMPGMTGTDVLRRIRSTRSAEQLPVIMVTAVSDSSAVAQALDLGANDYVTKPLDFQIALARIRTQLAMGREDSRVRKSEERRALASRSSGEGLWDWDLATNTVYCTPEIHSLAGILPREGAYHPRRCMAHVHPKDRSAFEVAFSTSTPQRLGLRWSDSTADPPDEIAIQFRFRHASGRYRWFSLRGVTLRDTEGNPIRRVGSITDVTARLTIDTLTGLANKRVLEEQIEDAILGARESPSERFCVLVFDIDHFKHMKPSLTQKAQQLLLVGFAERVQNVISEFIAETDERLSTPLLLARLDEDKFGILIGSVCDISEARLLADQLTRAMQPSFSIEEREIFCSINLGLVAQQPDHKNADDVLRDANTAMFAAELRGSTSSEHGGGGGHARLAAR